MRIDGKIDVRTIIVCNVNHNIGPTINDCTIGNIEGYLYWFESNALLILMSVIEPKVNPVPILLVVYVLIRAHFVTPKAISIYCSEQIRICYKMLTLSRCNLYSDS